MLIYGSLYPWHFISKHLDHSPIYFLFHSWEVFEGRRFLFDVIVNILVYVPLGMSAYLAERRYRSALISVFVPLMIGAALSASVEMLQLFTPGRDCSTIDLIDNVLGTGVGIALGWLFAKLTDFPLRLHYRPPDRVAAALLIGWVCWILFPFYPALWLGVLRAKADVLIHSPIFDPLGILFVAATWFSAARLLAALSLPRTDLQLTLLLAMLPVQFGITERYPTIADWLGAVLGVVAFRVLIRARHSDLLAAIALLFTIVFLGLTPFRFSGRHQEFYWLPFLAALNNTWQASIGTLLRKLFEYGAAIWLLTRSGLSLAAACLSVTVLLAAIEAAQLYLRGGHVAEITDPLLAVFLGAAFAVLRGMTPLRDTILRKA